MPRFNEPKPAAPDPKDEEPKPTLLDKIGEVFDGAGVATEPMPPACPHCGAKLISHETDTGPKANAWHCNNCGGCWVYRDDEWVSRDGHPAPTPVPIAP